jgi:hypothetical protein
MTIGSANRSGIKAAGSNHRLSNSSGIEAARGSGYSGAAADCGRGKNFGFARPAHAAWILQGVHINEHFAWASHRFPEIASRKSGGTAAFALGRK